MAIEVLLNQMKTIAYEMKSIRIFFPQPNAKGPPGQLENQNA